ncbi:Metallophosphoesterase domain-containing protein 1 [Achaetomium macrosporum]|uniref:Metallophosphoesterase domain-containing protein 1 n=1 Tax=Achaetomium macrosporum TaxID=79813 RepID=A0AAN7CBV6_9PEZI|nr:Metallophosphoesterase domain-containing protein 1 [Achaetomium macrosporum]
MPGITTRFLILSDTHADPDCQPNLSSLSADVAIHCGDLTEESKLCEFISAIDLLRGINAPLKLKKIAEAACPIESDLVKKEFGDYDEARQLFTNAKEAGIILLDEGRHIFTLSNGASLAVYASPYTPSPHAEMGFHPPRGVLDRTDTNQRAGCERLFAEVARARPKMHCFGHIHEGWGAKPVAWRGMTATDEPFHFTDVDNERSDTFETLASLKAGKWDSTKVIDQKEKKLETYRAQGYCTPSSSHTNGAEDTVQQTLFVNASIQGLEEGSQLPWLVEIELSRAVGNGDEGS